MHPEKGIKDFPDNGQYSLRILRIKVARLPDRITPRNDSKSGQCESHRERGFAGLRFQRRILYIHTVFAAMIAAQPAPETIHPGLWLGSQLARGVGRSVDTGYAVLSAELPGGGWPIGALVELLVQQPGVGEIRLLQPALSRKSKQSCHRSEAAHTSEEPAS
ncbi:hypothetical protein B0G80_9141 [Paraburkholderia sp. BL6669N2]|nr:hypothetical protein B0G80_9141 [Paraburkholderia sp. BL6669N2]